MLPPIRSLHQLSSAVRARRLSLGLTQANLAERAGVSRSWVNEFEAGKATAEIRIVLAVLDVLSLELTLAPREQPPRAQPAEDRATEPHDATIDLRDHLHRYGAP